MPFIACKNEKSLKIVHHHPQFLPAANFDIFLRCLLLIPLPADARQIDALGPLGLSVGQEFGVSRCGHNHLGQDRLMAVYDDVDMVFLHDP